MQFQDNYPLKNVTTLGIGGPAKRFVSVKTQEELIEALQYTKQNNLSYLIIGKGSNLLVSDEGFSGLVIKNEISGISTWEESKPPRESFRLPSFGPSQVSVCTKSGTPLQEFVDYSINHGLAGLQKLAGIPGTAGGAIYGNAGAYGQTISDHIITISALNINNLTVEQFNNSGFTYRDSIFKKNHFIILEVTFRLESGDPQMLKKEAGEVLSKRLVKYPPGIKCPGSFFKNLVVAEIPPQLLNNIPQEKIVYGKLPAGALLEEVGAKGQSSDGIKIADYHANLFINQGQGNAKTFYNLAKIYAAKVKEKFGITLEPEVQLINLPPII